MKYHRFGRLGWECSVLGMGVMRLPGWVESGRQAVDRPPATQMIRHGIDQGVNYLDLGFPWQMDRHRLILDAVREALENGYRERVKVALTVPASLIASPADFDACLDRQLEWLGTDAADFCLLGRLNRDSWPRLQELNILDRMEQALTDGRAQHVGFSFYDQYQPLKSVIQAYDRWTLAGLYYSYMDVKHNPGTNGVRYAAQSGLAVVVVEPFKGGGLTKEPPEDVRVIWEQAPQQWSRAEWALRFVLNEPAVSVVVSDMSGVEQLDENLATADAAEPDGLSIAEQVAISKVADAYRGRQRVPCPSCRACMPCPEGIDVPRFFEIYNDALIYNDAETARQLCEWEQIHPGDCTECGICERSCAKRLHIIEWLKEGRGYLEVE